MQLELLNAKRPCEAHPKTLVLVTGDGNIAPNGMCFREILDQYLRDGWFVEVHAWLATMARSYIEFQREYPSSVVIRPLDDDLSQIVLTRQSFWARTKAVLTPDVDVEFKIPVDDESKVAPRHAQAAPNISSAHPPAFSPEHIVPGIVIKYEAVGGLGTITKLDGSGADVHFSILYCDIKRPPPTLGERVMPTEGVSRRWGPCASMVRRTSIPTVAADAQEAPSKPVSKPEVTKAKANKVKSPSPTTKSTATDTPNASGASDIAQKTATPLAQSQAPVKAGPLRADQYDAMIRLLSTPEDSAMYLPSALAMLRRTRPEEATTIQEAEPATQRVLLLDSLRNELDSVLLNELALEWEGDDA